MSFFITHRYGGDERDPDLGALRALLAELDADRGDVEHPSVSVVHESDWALSVFVSGDVVLEHLEDDEIAPRHMRGPGRRRALALIEGLAQGRLDDLLAEPWATGYGT